MFGQLPAAGATGGYTCQADQSQDGSLDMADVPPFVTVLLRG